MQSQPRTPFHLQFPPAWAWLMEEAVPTWVKKAYSPRDSWKDKPFTHQDAIFFSKGVNDLSELFTEERPQDLPAYFQHPKYRSGYLLYFLPLQAAKFTTLFQLHPKALDAMVAHGRKTGAIRIADLGAGPGTASIALLLWLLAMPLASGEELPLVELDWFDTNRTIMEDGMKLVEMISTHFPRLRGKVKVRAHTTPWWRASSVLRDETSLVLVGHVLNEPSATPPQQMHNRQAPVGNEDIDEDEEVDGEFRPRINSEIKPLALLLERARGGGMLLVEPAARNSSQLISRLRDQLLQQELIKRDPTSIWGPCLHAEKCPLAGGRDWCHFSVPAEIPGKWFKSFSKGLGSERQWIKFSYFWIASPDAPAPQPHRDYRRVVSDPIRPTPNSRSATLLICEPVQPGRWTIPAITKVQRGDLMPVHYEQSLEPKITPANPSRSKLLISPREPRPKGRPGRRFSGRGSPKAR